MSEYKEIDECVKELNGLYDKLHERFCEGTFCTGCVLDKPRDTCILLKITGLIEEIEEKQQ